MSDSTDTGMALAATVRELRIGEYIFTCSYALWVYYCIITMDEEVSKIWSEIRKVGSILYMLIKYPLLISIILDMLVGWRLHLTISIHTCHQLSVALNFSDWVAKVSIEVAILLCLYALLGAEQKYLYAFGIIFVPTFITTLVMSNIILASDTYPSQMSDIDIELGYACPYMPWSDHHLYNAWVWVSLARTSLGALFLVVTLITRYRHQKGMLIATIRRDGILYSIVVIVLRLFISLLQLPGIRLEDQYGVITAIYIFIVPICTTQLIFNIRQGDDDGVPHAASALLFSGQRGSIQSDIESVTQDATNKPADLEMAAKTGQGSRPEY